MLTAECACGYTKQVADNLAGRKATCPRCSNVFRIGTPATATAVVDRPARVRRIEPDPITPPQPQIVYMQAPAPTQQPVIVNVIQNNNGSGQEFSPGVAALLSFFIPGLGQMYKGQLINGIAWFFIVAIGYVALIIPGLILHACCIIGAASGSRR